MFRIYKNLTYKYHIFLQRYNERLLKDALCVNLKAELQAKVIYHGLKACSAVNKVVENTKDELKLRRETV